MKTRLLLLLLLYGFIPLFSTAQEAPPPPPPASEQPAKEKKSPFAGLKPEAVKPVVLDPNIHLDPTYGLTHYMALIHRLNGDSIRPYGKTGYSGRAVDHYTDGSVAHKGYYSEGKLNDHKNFFPDGTLERSYKIMDDHISVLKVYWPDGKLKSEVKYYDDFAKEWTDYQADGQMDYYEAYHKSLEFFKEQRTYFENGNLQMSMVLTSKKDKLYERKEYFEDGQLKASGETIFNQVIVDYQKKGTWDVFNEKGELAKKIRYVNGAVQSEEEF